MIGNDKEEKVVDRLQGLQKERKLEEPKDRGEVFYRLSQAYNLPEERIQSIYYSEIMNTSNYPKEQSMNKKESVQLPTTYEITFHGASFRYVKRGEDVRFVIKDIMAWVEQDETRKLLKDFLPKEKQQTMLIKNKVGRAPTTISNFVDVVEGYKEVAQSEYNEEYMERINLLKDYLNQHGFNVESSNTGPRNTNAKKANYRIFDIIKCRVTGTKEYGVFVADCEEPYTKGLIHKTNLKNGMVFDATDFKSVGEIVHTRILKINPDSTLSLSLKDVKQPVDSEFEKESSELTMDEKDDVIKEVQEKEFSPEVVSREEKGQVENGKEERTPYIKECIELINKQLGIPVSREAEEMLEKIIEEHGVVAATMKLGKIIPEFKVDVSALLMKDLEKEVETAVKSDWENVRYYSSEHATERFMEIEKIEEGKDLTFREAELLLVQKMQQGEWYTDLDDTGMRYVKSGHLFFPCVRINVYAGVAFRATSTRTWSSVEPKIQRMIQVDEKKEG